MQAPEPMDNRRVQLLEVLVFLLLIVPSMVLSLFVIRTGHMEFVPAAVSVMRRDLSLVGLILYFLWRHGCARLSSPRLPGTPSAIRCCDPSASG